MKDTDIKNLAKVSLLFVFSAILLTVIQPPHYLSFLAWFAYVPFVLACRADVQKRYLLPIAYIVSSVYWIVNMHWLDQVTISGWLVFGFYTAILWPLLAVTIRSVHAKKLPLFIVLPILVVGSQGFQGFLLGGFGWRYLGHSQFQNLPLIQIADIFGASGVCFVVAMMNGLIAELIISFKQRPRKNDIIKAAIAVTLLIATLVYGHVRIRQFSNIDTYSPMIGALQSNIPQDLKDSTDEDTNYKLTAELFEISESIINSNARLVIWPETIVPAILDDRILDEIMPGTIHQKMDAELKLHSRNRAYLLVGAAGGAPTPNPDDPNVVQYGPPRYNSAFMYQPNGRKYRKQYNKIHILPFGEYIPFQRTLPLFYKLLMLFAPYDESEDLTAGSDFTIFDIFAPTSYRFAVVICYEDTTPDIVRKFILDENGNKQIDWLVNISNDGWYVKFEGDRITPSAELSQHASICVFRAVENRIPIIRSVNSGISCAIDSTGKMLNSYSQGDLPTNALQRQGMAGWFADKLPINNSVTFFTRYGRKIDIICRSGFIIAIFWPILTIIRRLRTGTKK